MSDDSKLNDSQDTPLPPVVEKDGIAVPAAPADAELTGIAADDLLDLVLKTTATVPRCSTEWVAERVHLPLTIVDGLLQQLADDHLLEVLGAEPVVGYRYAITGLGREHAGRLFEICGYVGPAPISLEAYTEMLKWQLSSFPRADLEDVQRALAHLVVSAESLQTAALAAMSQRSLFLSGPPGNGKTSIATALHKCNLGELWIPYCIGIGSEVIRVFDDQIHQVCEPEFAEPWTVDSRWVRVKRPLVVAGGEMTIESLDLSYSPSMRYYEAPMHFKANGGTFVIDDFGRQRVDHMEMLNRWIIPMEHGIDQLTLKTGQKIAVPFRQFLVVATNLDPDKVMDPAFLRRMGYRANIEGPTETEYLKIFRDCAERCDLQVTDEFTTHLLERYRSADRVLRGSEPHELIERCRDLCELQHLPFELSTTVLDQAWNSFFGTGSDT